MKRKNLLTTIAIGVGATIATVAAGYYAMSEHFYNKMIRRGKQEEELLSNPESNNELYFLSDLEDDISIWLEDASKETVYISTEDGLELAGELFHPEEESNQWVIIARGNNLNQFGLQNVAMEFVYDQYHALVVDCRGYGNSDGDYIGMGWHDRLDIMSWVDYVVDVDPQARIVLYGVSLSANAVMMASGELLPDNVRCVVEDSGFTSAYDYLSDLIKQEYRIRASLILEGLDSITRMRARYSLKSASSLKQLKKSSLPTLFIHGEEDEFVPLDHVFRLYHALSTEKELYTVPYAGHGEAMFAPRYFERVLMFCNFYSND